MQIIAEWAGHYYDPSENSDKVWAAAFTDTGGYLAAWGRRDNRKYQFQSKQFGNAADARAEYHKMIAQKEHKGYKNVPFEDKRYGNIPSFSKNLVGSSSSSTPTNITGPNLLERVRQLIRQVKEHFEPETMLVEFMQLRAASSLVLEYGEKIGSDASNRFVPADLELALNTLARSVRQAMLN